MIENCLVPTGKIIKDYLDEYGITQKELAIRMDSSQKHISNVLNSNSRLTEEFALKLEKILVGVPASYWLNYESKYREQIARVKEMETMQNWDLKSLANRFRFREVFKNLDLSLEEQALQMLKLLKINDFNCFESVYGELTVDFMEDGGDKEAIAIWLNMCESEIEIQNEEINTPYKVEQMKKELKRFRILASNSDTNKSIISARKLCNKLGIYLVFCDPITNSKVRGALTTYKNHPAIYLSGRYKSHSNTWFAFIHEIGHLILHYSKNDIIVSNEDNIDQKENEANQFARDFFINPEKYEEFCQKHIYTKESIRQFAREQDILPCFLVERLQHDKIIGHDEFKYL